METSFVARASHILIKHVGSKRPHDRVRDKKITRNKEEAIVILKEIRANIKTFEDFIKSAGEKSECGSAKRGGDLGNFQNGMMAKEFEEAVIKLKVGEMSGIVQSDSGFHLIWRSEYKPRTPLTSSTSDSDY